MNFNFPPLPPPPANRSLLDEMWQMHEQQMQALERIALLLQQQHEALSAAQARPSQPDSTPGSGLQETLR